MACGARCKKEKAGDGWRAVHKWLRTVIDYLACAYMILVLAVLPLYCPGGYTYIANRKNSLFGSSGTAMVKILVPALLAYGLLSFILYMKENKVLAYAEEGKRLWTKIKSGISQVDFFVAWYGAALIVSFLCTEYREAAEWGANGWYMGFYTQLIMVCSYFLISKFWKPRRIFLSLMLFVSAVVFLLGYLNRFSIYPVEMKDARASFISTIGNINWYCGYVTTVFFYGVALLWQWGSLKDDSQPGSMLRSRQEEDWFDSIPQGRQDDGQAGSRLEDRRAGSRKTSMSRKGRLWQRAALIFYVFLGFATLVTQGSASGIFALCVMLLVLFVLSAEEGDRMLGFGRVWLLLWMACLFTKLFRIVSPNALNYRDEFVDLFTGGVVPVVMTFLSLIFAGWVWGAVKRGVYRKKILQFLARIMVTVVSCAAVALALMITINTMHPGSIGELSEYEFFTFSDSWGSSRGATWKYGLRVFMEQDPGHKLTGAGPDAMAAYIYDGGSEALADTVRKKFGNARLTNAHNEWITILADVGLLGLAGFGGMIVSAIRIMLRRDGDKITCACGLCLLAYTVNNVFSFQQVMNTPTAFVLLGMGMAFYKVKDEKGGINCCMRQPNQEGK